MYLLQGIVNLIHLLLAVDIDIIGIGDVAALGAASYADEAVNRLAVAEDATDVRFAFLDGDAGRHDDLDVEVLREYEFFFLFCHVYCLLDAKIGKIVKRY